MKLTDFDKNIAENASKALREHYEMPLNLSKMKLAETRSMLSKVRGLINETRKSKNIYESQKSSAYLKLVFMEQALADHYAILSKKKPNIVVENEEIEKSQVLLAAQDMVDSIQKMLEEVSDMVVKELPALADSIQSEIGVNESSNFNTKVTGVLSNLQSSLTTTKAELQNALNGLTGQGGDEAFNDEMGDEMDGDDLGMGDEGDEGMGDFEEPEMPEMPEEPEDTHVASIGRNKR